MLQECTFKPALVAHRRRTSAASSEAPTPGFAAAAAPSQPEADDTAATVAPAATVPDDAELRNTPAAAAPSAESAAPPRTAVTSARAGAASAAHRSVDHSKYTSLEAQVISCCGTVPAHYRKLTVAARLPHGQASCPICGKWRAKGVPNPWLQGV